MLSRSVVSDSLRPHGCSPPGSSVHGDSPGKNTGVVYHALLQGIFPTQVSCIADSLQTEPPGKPIFFLNEEFLEKVNSLCGSVENCYNDLKKAVEAAKVNEDISLYALFVYMCLAL